MPDPNETVLSFENSLLRASDINLLRGPRWLNDQIISFYLEYLENRTYKNHNDILFVSPEVVQCIKLVSRTEMGIFLEPLKAMEKNFIILPLNDNEEDRAGGGHWSLLVFSRPEQTFFHYDSFERNNFHHCYQFVRELAHGVGCADFELQSCECLQQSNGYDCGIHVLCNIDCIAKQIVARGRIELAADDPYTDGVSNMTPNIINKKRGELLKLIDELKRK